MNNQNNCKKKKKLKYQLKAKDTVNFLKPSHTGYKRYT